MSSLGETLNEYLAIRRALGFELREVAGCLRTFVTFLETNGATHITTELALRWATRPGSSQPSTWAWRLGMVRRFAAWLSAAEPRTEIPPAGLLPYQYQRKRPHIFSDEEIEQILGLAAQLPSEKGLRAHTYATLRSVPPESRSQRSRPERSRSGARHRLPGLRGERTGQQRHDAKRSSRRCPRFLSLCWRPSSRAIDESSADARGSVQTNRPASHRIPGPRRDRYCPCRNRPHRLARVPRLRSARDDVQYRCAGAGDHRPPRQQPATREALSTAPVRQRAKGTILPALATNGAGPAVILRGAPNRSSVRREGIFESSWRTPNTLRSSVHFGQTPGKRSRQCPNARPEAAPSSQHAPQHGRRAIEGWS